MSRSPSSSTSAQTANSVRNTAEKQTLIISYFESQCNKPKRKRRNLECSEYAQKPATSEAQSVAVEEEPCQSVPASDDKHDCLKSDNKMEVEAMPFCVTSSISHTEQSDSDSCDFISPSPTAASSSSNFLTTLSGKMKKPSDKHISTPATNAADRLEIVMPPNSRPDESTLQIVKRSDSDSCDYISPSPIAAASSNMLNGRMKRASGKHISTPANVGTNAADRLEMAMLPNSAPDESKLQIVKRFNVHRFYRTATSEHQPNVKEVDRHDRARQMSGYQFSESNEDAQNSSILSADIPSPSDANAEFSSKFPVAEENIDDTESHALESCQKPTRRQFMEKVINVLSF